LGGGRWCQGSKSFKPQGGEPQSAYTHQRALRRDFLGKFGAGNHYEYGPTGDTANTASRVDGLNKYLGTEVLVSEESIAQVDGLATG